MTTVSTDKYFKASPSGVPTPPAQPGMLGRALGGVQRVTFSPLRGASAEAAQGLADRLSELFNSKQPEITNNLRNVFTNALLRRTPETYHQLLHHIQAFLRAGTLVDFKLIKK